MSKRTGNDTKAAAVRVALALFSEKGYQATSMREIAEELGISKAALYYHFAGKDDIVRAGMVGRGDEAAELLTWLRAQPAAPDLIERTVLRWVDSFSADKLRGIRFVNANPAVLRTLGRDGADAGAEIAGALASVATELAGVRPDPTRLLLIRMALLSINAAVAASENTDLTDDQIVAAARASAAAIVGRLPQP